jgi:hypothetical protein
MEKVSESDVEDDGTQSFDDTGADHEVFSLLSSPNRPIPFPSTQPSLAVHRDASGSDDEEVIIISGKMINLYLETNWLLT